MTEQAGQLISNLLTQTQTTTTTVYNQGIMDGIMLLKNMIEEHPEIDTKTVKETCEEFIKKYSQQGEEIPDVPDIADNTELKVEPEKHGLTDDSYSDLLSAISEFHNEEEEAISVESTEEEIV